MRHVVPVIIRHYLVRHVVPVIMRHYLVGHVVPVRGIIWWGMWCLL